MYDPEENLRELLEKCKALLEYVERQSKRASLAWEHSSFDKVSGFDESLIEDLQIAFDRFKAPG